MLLVMLEGSQEVGRGGRGMGPETGKRNFENTFA